MTTINISAPINTLGYGIVGLNTLLAMERLGREPALWPIGTIESPERHHEVLRRALDRQAFYNPKAPSVRIWHQFALAEHVGKGPHCGLPIFELNRFMPNELHHLLAQDIIFAPSEWAGQVLEDNGVPPDRIAYAPFGVDREVFAPPVGGSEAQTITGNPTIFLNCGKWELRKGHDILAEAFCKAFMPSDNVRLVMNCFNPCFRDAAQMKRYNDQWVGLYKTSQIGDKIDIVQGRLPSQTDVALLMAAADCGVFPSRAEGWGLESAEMLAMGKHVILTNYAGHTEYANADNSLLINIDRLEDAHDGIWFDASRSAWGGKPGQWAELGEAQVDQLVEHMRCVHRRKQEGLLGINQAAIDSMARFTWEETAREIVSVL